MKSVNPYFKSKNLNRKLNASNCCPNYMQEDEYAGSDCESFLPIKKQLAFDDNIRD